MDQGAKVEKIGALILTIYCDTNSNFLDGRRTAFVMVFIQNKILSLELSINECIVPFEH